MCLENWIHRQWEICCMFVGRSGGCDWLEGTNLRSYQTFNSWMATPAKCMAALGRGTQEVFWCVILLPFNLIKSASVACRSPWKYRDSSSFFFFYSTVHRPWVRGNHFNFSSWWASTHWQLSHHNRWYLGEQFSCGCPQYERDRQGEKERKYERQWTSPCHQSHGVWGDGAPALISALQPMTTWKLWWQRINLYRFCEVIFDEQIFLIINRL